MSVFFSFRSSALFGTLAVIGAYVLVRAWVYHVFPITSLETWFVRDTFMTIPRLAAFGALLMLNRRWKMSAFDMPLREGPRAALMGFVPLALWIWFFSTGHGQRFTPAMMAVGFFTSLAVGLFEEYAFRGLLLSAFSQRFSLLTTIIVSNILFAVYHIQAQPIGFWPVIFLSGAIFANLRLRGLSVGCLALIHGVTDACFFFFPCTNPEPFSFYGLTFQAGLLIYAVITLPRSTLRTTRH